MGGRGGGGGRGRGGGGEKKRVRVVESGGHMLNVAGKVQYKDVCDFFLAFGVKGLQRSTKCTIYS